MKKSAAGLRHEPTQKTFAMASRRRCLRCGRRVYAPRSFNCYVAERLRQETFDARLEGDLTSRKGLGGGSATAQETLTVLSW